LERSSYPLNLRKAKDLSQSIVVKTLSSQVHLKLNMPNVDQLISFNAGDFAVLYGSHSVSYLTSLLCVRAQLPAQLGGLASDVVYVDGSNTFRLYQVSRLAQIHNLNPKQVLDRVHIARAFTAYQMTALITEKLKETVEKYSAKLVIISDIAGTFLDKDIPEDETCSIYRHVASYLSVFAKAHNLILITTQLPHKNTQRNSCLQTLTCISASVVASLRKTTHEHRFVLEKHPSFVLGYAVLSSETPTLMEFMERAS
jgi:hypothetical protein